MSDGPEALPPRAASVIGAIGVILVALVAPIIWSGACSSAYFDDGRCACGHDIFIRLKGDSYLSYSPGHGVPEHKKFGLRRKDAGWEVLALPPTPEFWSPLKGGQVVAKVSLQNGELYESFAGTTNWTRHARVYSPWRLWRLWAAKLLNE